MISYFENIIRENPNQIIRALDDDAWMDTQMHGRADNAAQIEALIDKEIDFYKRQIEGIKRYKKFGSNQFEAVEFELQVNNHKVLPATLVCEHKGDHYQSIRVYHSTYPFTASHAYRPPVFTEIIDLNRPKAVAHYFASLKQGNVDDIMAVFAGDETYFREPAGWEWTYRGIDDLRAHYAEILADGGIDLVFHNLVYDEEQQSVAVEFTCVGWGETKLKPQAGMAVYDLDAKSGKIKACRIYDDVDLRFQ